MEDQGREKHMEQFEWNSNYATGIREIDTQHAYLFALTNRLIRHTADSREAANLAQILTELNAYVDSHFSYEESIMEQAGYAHLAEHKAHHERMRTRLTLYASELLNDALTVGELTDFLKTWLKLHILREDMKYIPAVSHLKDGA